MLSDKAQQLLKLFAAANGQFVKAEVLLDKTGLTEPELQAAASELENQSLVKLAGGGELAGKALRFYSGLIMDKGVSEAGKLNLLS